MSYETFKCPICKAVFATPDQLREHSMKAHKGQAGTRAKF